MSADTLWQTLVGIGEELDALPRAQRKEFVEAAVAELHDTGQERRILDRIDVMERVRSISDDAARHIRTAIETVLQRDLGDLHSGLDTDALAEEVRAGYFLDALDFFQSQQTDPVDEELVLAVFRLVSHQSSRTPEELAEECYEELELLEGNADELAGMFRRLAEVELIDEASLATLQRALLEARTAYAEDSEDGGGSALVQRMYKKIEEADDGSHDTDDATDSLAW